MPDPIPVATPDDVAAAARFQRAHARIKAELRKAIVGMDEVIDQLLIAIFARGHCLLVGVPGLAKTLLISHARRRASRCRSTASSSRPTSCPPTSRAPR